MKKIINVCSFLIIAVITMNSCFAISTGKIEKMIKESKLDETSTVSLSIKNADTDNVVYEYNSKKLIHPASVLKLITTYPAIDALGRDYMFRTQLYKDNQNNLYIKLGADPLLTSSQLHHAFSTLKEKGLKTFNNIYIDDSVMDKKEFAQGWMWDDDINAYTPKVSAYNLDGNVIDANTEKNSDGSVRVDLKPHYSMSVVSDIKSGAKKTSLEINRYNWNNPELVEIKGDIIAPFSFKLPISSMRRYFIYNLDKCLDDNGIIISGTMYASKLVPSDAELITEVLNPLNSTIGNILQNSNNLMSETIYKLAGGYKYSSTGSDELGFKMLKDFYKKEGLNLDNMIIADGCGVSRNNLLSSDWITSALNKLYRMKDFDKYKEFMAQPGEGTLSKRLYDLRGSVWLKTGSLSNISAIAGYIESKDGNTYSAVIVIQNFTNPQTDIKMFEDELIKLIYNR